MTAPLDGAPGMPLDARRRYFGHSEISIRPRDRLVIAGIVRADTRLDLEPDARFEPLLPHDGDLVLERTDPDLVLVESRAFTVAHPWAGGGDPTTADVAMRLLRILEVARLLGRPTVLWWSDVPSATPALATLETRFDFVLGSVAAPSRGTAVWDPGVQLRRFSPIGAPARRAMTPVFHRRWDRLPSRRQATSIEAIHDALGLRLERWVDGDTMTEPNDLREPGSLVGDVRRLDADELGDAYRAHGLFVAEPADGREDGAGVSRSALRQLASGARVVGSATAPDPDAMADWIDAYPDPATFPAVVRSAASAPHRSGADLRSLLRQVFLRRETSVALESLAREAEIPMPATRRGFCAVARLDATLRPAAFVDAVSRQDLRPSEALVVADDATDAADGIREFERVGVPARPLFVPAGRNLIRRAASQATAPWLWVWGGDPGSEPVSMIDLVVAGKMSEAGVIGHGPVAGYGRRLDRRGVIVAREAAISMPDVGQVPRSALAARGATVYAVEGAAGDEDR
jgi:hypothetical protein